MYSRIIATLALSIIFHAVSAQISFHRLYETSLDDQTGMVDTFFYHMSSTTVTGDVYSMGTKRIGDSASDYEDLSVIFTKLDPKGNIDWARELDLGSDSVKIVSICDFEFNGTQDSILFAIDIETNGEQKEIFGRITSSGSDISLRGVGGYSAISGLITQPNVIPFINQSDLLLTTAVQPIISRIGLGEDLLWSRAYEFINSDGDSILNNFVEISSTPDSTIIAVGQGSTLTDFVVAELDSNGVQIWAESYTFTINNLGLVAPLDVEPLENGNFAIVGNYTLVGPLLDNSFVAVVDSAGSVLISKKLIVENNRTYISNVLQAADGTLWLSGITEVNDTSAYFTANMDLDGLINWTTIYPGQEAGYSARSTGLLPVQSTGGATLIGHGFLDDLAVMQVMKHDVDGTTPCSDTTSTIVEDIMITSDTLTSQVKNGGIFFDSIAYELSTFGGFSPPELSITQLSPFCPNEPIDTFLVASVSGVSDENISYMWGEGQLTDTIAINQDGMYMVTVTITEDVCYMMCDTVEVSRLQLPQVQINIDNSRYCDEKLFVLNGLYTPGASNPTYLWSTGATTPAIEVTSEGTYAVTVTDDCGESASNEIEIIFPEQLSLSITESSTFNIICADGGHRLSALLVGGIQPSSYIWSTQETGFQIAAATSGTYTVTATDACGDSLVESIDVVVKETPTSGEITYELDCNEDNNALSRITFNATTNIDNPENANVQLLVYSTVDGEIQDLVSDGVIPSDPLPLGNYLAVLRICDEVDIASVNVNATALCGGLLRYPIAFFPGGQDEQSATFGPIPNDTMNVQNIISNVEFKVFNRWGETVFESNDILDAWDGTHKGEPAPSEVYIWYVSYIVEGVEMVDKGDVTLIR